MGPLAKMCRTKNPGLKPKVHGLNQFSVEEESKDNKHLEDDQNDSEDPEYVWTLKNKKLNSVLKSMDISKCFNRQQSLCKSP